jgi:hypothetical protein
MYYTYGDFLKKKNELDQMPDMSTWIDSKWLKEIAPNRVRLSKYKL